MKESLFIHFPVEGPVLCSSVLTIMKELYALCAQSCEDTVLIQVNTDECGFSTVSYACVCLGKKLPKCLTSGRGI